MLAEREQATASHRRLAESRDTRLGWLAAALPVGLLLVATSYQGAFATRHWAPVAILALTVLIVPAFSGNLRVPEWPARVALAALWALALWALLSATWAESPAAAIEGAGRTALYAALFTIPCAMLASGSAAARVGALMTVGVAAISVVTLIRLLADGPDLFLVGRLDDPVGYRNASGCLFALGFWPLVAVAARRDANALLRALAISAGVVALGLAFLTQARGVGLGLAAGGVVVLALGPDRLRRAWIAIAAAAAIGSVSGALLEPFQAFSDHGEASAADIAVAVEALAWLAVGAFAVAFVVALVDGGLRLPDAARTAARRLLSAGLVAVAVVGVVAGIAVVGNPISFVGDRVEEFRSLETTATGNTRLTFGGGQRADLWRVALIELADRPLTGVGEGSYEFGYYRERRSDRNLSEPHSLPFRIAAELGIVGLTCLLLFAAGLAAAVARRWDEASVGSRRRASALLAAGTVGFANGAVDWLWLVPAVTGLSVLALGLGVAVLRPVAVDQPAATPSARSRAVRLATTGALLATTAVVAFVYLGDASLREAQRVDPERPRERLRAAERAEGFNPWSTGPLYVQAGALENLGRRAAARRRLRAALELEPDSFVTLALLGDLETRAGRHRRARVYYRRALALNPLDVGLRKLAGGPS